MTEKKKKDNFFPKWAATTFTQNDEKLLIINLDKNPTIDCYYYWLDPKLQSLRNNQISRNTQRGRVDGIQ